MRGLLCAAIAIAGCGGRDQPAATRLSRSADPAAPRENVTQWNWGRSLAVDGGGGLHAVWTQLASTDIEYPADRPDPIDVAALPAGEIRYAGSSDGGRSWSGERTLVDSAVGVDAANVAASGDDVYLVWRAVDGDRLRIFFRRSSDRGATFGAAVAISDNPAGVSASPPSVVADGSSVRIVWPDGRPQPVGNATATVKEIYLAASEDRGATFGPVRAVSTPDGRSSWTPSVAAGGGAIHVAWTDERDDLGECSAGTNPCREEEYYRRSLDGGATFGPELRLTSDPPNAPAASWAPSLAVDGDAVHLVYFDQRSGRFQIFYRRSLDGGASFGDDVLISTGQEATNAARAVIAARGGAVHVAWFTYADFPADVFHAASLDGGTTWSPPAALTADAPSAAARLPHIAVGPDRAPHVIWYDTRDSDGGGARVEIYYASPK